MKSLDQLVFAEGAWPQVQEWLAASPNGATILRTEREQGERALLGLQVTNRSAMGAVVLETGGILFQHNWLRFFGAGILDWNGSPDDFLIVAHDVVGGFFALNGGGLPGEPGSSFYLPPDTLRWEALELTYSELLHWAATGDLDQFYSGLRWPNWQAEVEPIKSDEAISFYPPLWAEPGLPLAERSRAVVPLREVWAMQLEIAAQLKDVPDGATVRIEITD